MLDPSKFSCRDYTLNVTNTFLVSHNISPEKSRLFLFRTLPLNDRLAKFVNYFLTNMSSFAHDCKTRGGRGLKNKCFNELAIQNKGLKSMG